MNELFREIEEELRQERFDRAWRHLGKIMIAVSAVIIAVTVAAVVWQDHRQSQAMESTSAFVRGLERVNVEDYKGAVSAFDALAHDKSSPYYGLAMLQKAEAQAAGGDKDGAAKTYQTLAAEDTVFGVLAAMRVGKMTGEPAAGSPLYYTQSEWLAWQMLKGGKKDDAVARFLALRDNPEAPYSMRERLAEAVEYLAPEKSMRAAHE